MKINKISQYIYGFLMLMPIFMTIGYLLFMIFTRATDNVYDNGLNICRAFDIVMFGGAFDFASTGPFYSMLSRFAEIIGGSDFAIQDAWVCYGSYVLTISLFYLGIEVLLAFINIARKLVYAFVDKEF